MSFAKRELESRQLSRRKNLPHAMRELQLMEQEITRNQVIYWQERIDKLRINDTGALRSSIVGMVHSGPVTTIEHSFLLYGIHVSNGVAREFGRGYTDSLGRTYTSNRGGEGTWNEGQLPFLLPGGEQYRRDHGLDKKKKVGPAWGGRKAGGRPHNARDAARTERNGSRLLWSGIPGHADSSCGFDDGANTHPVVLLYIQKVFICRILFNS